jgi:hypothetical protein
MAYEGGLQLMPYNDYDYDNGEEPGAMLVTFIVVILVSFCIGVVIGLIIGGY